MSDYSLSFDYITAERICHNFASEEIFRVNPHSYRVTELTALTSFLLAHFAYFADTLDHPEDQEDLADLLAQYRATRLG